MGKKTSLKKRSTVFYDGDGHNPFHQEEFPGEMVPTPDKNPY